LLAILAYTTNCNAAREAVIPLEVRSDGRPTLSAWQSAATGSGRAKE